MFLFSEKKKNNSNIIFNIKVELQPVNWMSELMLIYPT